MDTLFKNSILFISGFIVAVVVYKSPINVISPSTGSDSNYSSGNDDSSSVSDLAKRPRFGEVVGQKPTAPFQGSNRNSKYQGYSNGSNYSDLNGVPSMAVRSDDQIPTAPPTGRPDADAAIDEENERLAEEAKAIEEANKNKLAQTNSRQAEPSKYSNSANEQSLSSVMPIIGFVGNDSSSKTDNSSKDGQASGGSAGYAGGGGGRRGNGSTPGDNGGLEVLPEEFTPAGLQIARRQFASQELSEIEYLEYISLGLESSDPELAASAANGLVTVKTRNAFTLQSQYASASPANAANLNQAILANYKSASDLSFLSQMIADGSSVEAQSWAIHSLDVVVRGASMDFNNQQIRDILVNNISGNLVKLDSNHPSFGLAQSISRDINSKLA